jgi:ABC-type multidrug transport system ATPase subunit
MSEVQEETHVTEQAALTAEKPAPAIRTTDLHKKYAVKHGTVHAVRGIDLEVSAGAFFGLLGPNGAGKSTTISMLTTLTVPTEGRAWVAGVDVIADPVGVKRRIGVVAQGNTLDRSLTVAENLEFRARFFGASRKQAKRRAAELLELLGLTDQSGNLAYQMSGGQAKRLMIARALVHQPEVLFLDEPTAGLDPQSRVSLQRVLRVLHAAGQTILLTTHRIDEAEQLCDQVAVMDGGKLLAHGGVDDLKRQAGADTVITVTYDGKPPGSLTALDQRESVTKVEFGPCRVRVYAREPAGLLSELVAAGAASGLTAQDAVQLKPSLETVFLALTGREYRNDGFDRRQPRRRR